MTTTGKPRAIRWHIIPSLPNYLISPCGQLKSLIGKCGIRKYSLNRNGSPTFTVKKDGYNTNVSLARLMGEVFCKDYSPELAPRYRDGDKTNCLPRNLKWVSRSEVTGAPYSKNARPTTSPVGREG